MSKQPIYHPTQSSSRNRGLSIAGAALLGLVCAGCTMAAPPHSGERSSGSAPEPALANQQQDTEMTTDDERQAGIQGMAPPALDIQPKPLTLATIELARATDSTSHDRLRDQLTDEGFLTRLDSAEVILRMPPEYLQLSLVLRVLAESPAPIAAETLDYLASNPAYRDYPRSSALLQASAHMKSAPPNIQAFWGRKLRLDSGERGLTLSSMVENGSAEAIDFLVSALLVNQEELDLIVAWLQDSVLTHRHDLELLRGCRRLLEAGDWPSELKAVVVEVLFDYRPDDWYFLENEPPKPPNRATLSEKARGELLDIANWALRAGYIGRKRHAEIRAELGMGTP